MSYEHLRLGRETPLTTRHPRKGFSAPAPSDPRAHGLALKQSFEVARQHIAQEDLGGFDDR